MRPGALRQVLQDRHRAAQEGGHRRWSTPPCCWCSPGGSISILILYVLPKFSEFFTGMDGGTAAADHRAGQLLTLVMQRPSCALMFAPGRRPTVGFDRSWKSCTPTGAQVQLSDAIQDVDAPGGRVWHLYAVSRFCRTWATLVNAAESRW